MREIVVNKVDSNLKLDKFLLKYLNVNNTFLFKMEREKMVRVNDKHPLNFKILLSQNDIVKIYLNDSFFKNFKKEKLENIVYEDDNLIIYDKPKKMPVYFIDNNHNNVLDIITSYLIRNNELNLKAQNAFKPQISTRLDTNTMGLVIISKNEKTLKLINKLIENHKVRKFYKAITKGSFIKKEDTLIDYLIKDEKNSIVKISKDQKENSYNVITKYNIISNKEDKELLDIELITGRTHQIRAHLAFYGHPVLGDYKYGDQKFNLKYNKDSQELLCYKLLFPNDSLEHLSYLKNMAFISKRELYL